MSGAGIIFSNLNEKNLSRITKTRTCAAIPFGCRYRLIDFPLSCMVNAEISNISVIANYNFRSLTEHLGSGKDWDLARRDGGIHLFSPYQTATTPNAPIYCHHLEALLSMEQFIKDIKEDYVVLADTDNICNMDLKKVLKQAQDNDADLTLVTHSCSKDFTRKGSSLFIKNNGLEIEDIITSDRYVEGYSRFMNCYVFKTQALVSAIDFALNSNAKSLSRDIVMNNYKNMKTQVYNFEGTAYLISSFTDYYKVSIELATNEEFRKELFGTKNQPILTKVHNSAPTIYSQDAQVKNSMIADGCIIEGTVENSIISRGCHVGKGAVVKNSVVLGKTTIEDGASINCVVTDKLVTITKGTSLSGAPTLPFYVLKNQKV